MTTYSEPKLVTVSEGTPIQPGAMLALIVGGVAVLTAAVFFLQIISAQKETEGVKKEVAVKEVELATLQPVADSLTNFNGQAVALHALFDKQKRWEVVLDKVQERMYKRMAVTSFSINDQGLFAFSGVTNDYVDYAKLFSSLTDPANASGYFLVARPGPVVKTDEKTTGGTATGNYEVGFSFNVVLGPSALGTTSTTPAAPQAQTYDPSANFASLPQTP